MSAATEHRTRAERLYGDGLAFLAEQRVTPEDHSAIGQLLAVLDSHRRLPPSPQQRI